MTRSIYRGAVLGVVGSDTFWRPPHFQIAVEPGEGVDLISQQADVRSNAASCRRHDMHRNDIHSCLFRCIQECGRKHRREKWIRFYVDEIPAIPGLKLEVQMHFQIIGASRFGTWFCFHEGQNRESTIFVKGSAHEH